MTILVCKMDSLTLWPFDLLTPKAYHFEYIPRSFPIPGIGMNTVGSFVFELCCGQTDRQTNRQSRSSNVLYPRRSTESAWVINDIRNCTSILAAFWSKVEEIRLTLIAFLAHHARFTATPSIISTLQVCRTCSHMQPQSVTLITWPISFRFWRNRFKSKLIFD